MNRGFLGFPEKMHNKAVKLTNFTAKMFPFSPKPVEIFYTVNDGDFSDLRNWETVSGRPVVRIPGLAGNLPNENGDDIYIRHNLTVDNAGVGIVTFNNIFISGRLSFINSGGSAKTWVISRNGSINVSDKGILDVGGVIGATANLFRIHCKYISIPYNNFIAGTSAMQFIRAADDQEIPALPYHSIEYGGGGGKKYLPKLPMAITGNVSRYGADDGAATFLVKPDGAYLTIGGLFSASGFAGNFEWLGDEGTIELRGGINVGTNQLTCLSTSNTFLFTTNNQAITGGSTAAGATLNCKIVIRDNITVTHNSGFLQLNQAPDGQHATATLTNTATMYFNFTGGIPMPTMGLFVKTASTNVVGYVHNSSFTLPDTVYQGLYIAGTGIKTAAGNTTLSTTLNNVGNFELSTHNLTVTTTTFLSGLLSKSGSGNVLFTGLLTLNSTATPVIDFSVGNPTVELRAGISATNTPINSFKTGTGLWTFSTNNQSILMAGGMVLNFSCQILISGAITLKLDNATNTAVTNQYIIFNDLVTGNNAASTLLNEIYLRIYTTTMPMAIGIFDHTTSNTSNIGIYANGTFVLPYTVYQGLEVAGTGTKTLAGNTTVALNLSNYGTLELSTYDLTVSGATTNAVLSKTGAGALLFIGSVNWGSIDFSVGNPTVEMRGGMQVYSQTLSSFKTGTGLWSFTTNNQTFITGTTLHTFDCPIIISGAITVTNNSTASHVFKGTLDGNNAASKWDNRVSNAGARLEYQNATMPMVTGLLETNAAANGWYYNGATNQDIKGGTYRTLVLAGGAFVKTLQGNVVVVTSYTLTAPTTLNLNGFTRT